MTPTERAAFLAHTLTGEYRRAIARAEAIIQRAIDALPPAFVAVSWGKDSVVMLHLVQRYLPDVPVVHVGDRHEDWLDNYTAVRDEYARRQPLPNYNHVEVEIGGASVTAAINNTPLPEQYPARYLGLRLEENGGRVFALRRYGAIHQYTTGQQAGQWRICPLIDWRWRDVWAYIADHELPHLSAYDHPALGPKSTSRTSSVYSRRLFTASPTHGGLQMGRVAAMRQYAPRFYDLVREKSRVLGDMI